MTPYDAPQAAPALTQDHIDKRVFELYDEYCHGKMDRREFLARAAALTAGGLAMAENTPHSRHRVRYCRAWHLDSDCVWADFIWPCHVHVCRRLCGGIRVPAVAAAG